jgi:hypothetical protein
MDGGVADSGAAAEPLGAADGSSIEVAQSADDAAAADDASEQSALDGPAPQAEGATAAKEHDNAEAQSLKGGGEAHPAPHEEGDASQPETQADVDEEQPTLHEEDKPVQPMQHEEGEELQPALHEGGTEADDTVAADAGDPMAAAEVGMGVRGTWCQELAVWC